MRNLNSHISYKFSKIIIIIIDFQGYRYNSWEYIVLYTGFWNGEM